MKNYCIIMYSHSSYSDAWEMFCGQIEKYLPKEIKRYAFVDESNNLPENWEIVTYDESLSYNKRMASCLNAINEEYVIIHHEDMPLYDKPDLDFIEDKIEMMPLYNIDYIKLIKGGNVGIPETQFSDKLYELPRNGDCYFSVQPSLCKRESLQKLYENCDVENIHEFEPKAHLMSILLNYKNLYYYDNEPQRGLCHWDSKVYPYVATAIVKGKWNYSEYESELSILHKEYNIDKNIRGEFL